MFKQVIRATIQK